MPDQHHTLSEISHLFLSAVREKASPGSARPQRTPPKPTVSIDLTPEEFAAAAGELDDAQSQSPRGHASVSRVSAVLCSHLSGKPIDRVKDYARHLAAQGTRVGLIEMDASEFRVMCFDKHTDDAPPDAPPTECFDPRQMTEVLDELSWDVQRWLLVLPAPRVPEARALLRDVDHWLLLSTCDHDGVIACYRTLKGLTDLWPAGRTEKSPHLSLALLDANDAQQAERVSSKLATVCQQFLNWPLETEANVRVGEKVSEHLVMSCRPMHDKGQIASAPHWQIASDFVARSKQSQGQSVGEEVVEPRLTMQTNPKHDEAAALNEVAGASPSMPSPTHAAMPAPARPPMVLRSVADDDDTADVIDLPETDGTERGIIDAILKHCSNELVECPIAPPMCPKARLAVGRDRRLVMLAVARQGLSDLSTIGQAYKWLRENQTLIGMAVPQLSIDTHQPPHLSLLINQADSAAQTLQPMLQGGHVTVKTYRKLRWGNRTGLLLEAA